MIIFEQVLKLNMYKEVKIVFVCLLILFVFSECKRKDHTKQSSKIKQEQSNRHLYPKFEFTKEIHKFGEISEGEIAVCDFYYKNIGKADLIISKIESNCGCTVVKWNKKPLKVGEEAKITVEFNSEGRYGKQYKKLSLYCNTLEGIKELIVTAQVK